MKVKLKEFPNGSCVVYQGRVWKKCASRLINHFMLVEERGDKDTDLKPMLLYLHRDTYVEPIMSQEKF